MTVTQIWRGSQAPAADAPASATSGRHSRSRSHRARPALWAWLNAQALLNGAAGTPGGVADRIEDDYRRLAARRAH